VKYSCRLAIVAFATVVGARAQVAYDLPKLVSTSNVIAVVRVAATVQTGSGTVQPYGQPIPAHFRVASLHVLCALKGEASQDLSVPYSILYAPNGAGWGGGVPEGYTIRDTFIPNAVRLVFLKRAKEGFALTNGAYLSLVSSPEAECADALAPLDAVVSRIADVLFTDATTRDEKAESIRQLRYVNTESVVPALKRFLIGDAGRNDGFLRAETLAAILCHHDASVLDLAESELLRPDDAGYWRSNLLYAITQAAPPSRSIPILAKAFSLPDAEIRTHAAEVIYQTGSVEGIPPLLGALDYPDPYVAFAVMQGLGNLTHEYEWRPKSIEPDAPWHACLDHWRDYRTTWLREHQAH
jgi:hypothetical protein